MIRLVACSLLVFLAACAESPPAGNPAPVGPAASTPADLATTYRPLAGSGGTVYAIDPAASQVRIYAFRGGKAAMAGHNHVISAPEFDGFAYVPDKGMADARFDLQFPLAKLVIDDPTLRQETGGAFATPVSADAVSGTRDHMLGARGLEADKFPLVSIHSARIAGEIPRLAATVSVTLHGVTRELLVPLTVSVKGGVLEADGAFALRQTDFGMQPYSVLGGLLSVLDEVVIEFRLAGKPAPF